MPQLQQEAVVVKQAEAGPPLLTGLVRAAVTVAVDAGRLLPDVVGLVVVPHGGVEGPAVVGEKGGIAALAAVREEDIEVAAPTADHPVPHGSPVLAYTRRNLSKL